MKTFIFLLSLFSFLTASSQKVTILLKSDSDFIAKATVYDVKHDVVLTTDDNGEVIFQADDYNLRISHILFKSLELSISKPLHDTIIVLVMERRRVVLDPVVITSATKKKIIAEVGNGFQSTMSTYTGYTKVGIYVEYPTEQWAELRSIKFRLKKTSSYLKENYFLEIRIYAVTNFLIADTPLNKLPIILNRSQFKSKNEIMLKEKIRLPGEGIFVSMQVKSNIKLPFSIHSPAIVFPMHKYHNGSIAYINTSANPDWEPRTLAKKSYLTDFDGIPISISFGITYFKH